MPCVQVAPLLLTVLMVAFLSLVIWGVVRVRASATSPISGAYDNLLLIGLVLAAFSAGVFSSFVLLAVVGH